jgi:hypothetical protein
MWVLLNDSFLSIVRHRSKPNHLLVRARRREDIALIFPAVRIVDGGGTDYEFRAVVKRRAVENAMAAEVRRIDYDNFKDSVPEKRRHDVYLSVWSVLMRLGRRAPIVVMPTMHVEPTLDSDASIDWADQHPWEKQHP